MGSEQAGPLFLFELLRARPHSRAGSRPAQRFNDGGVFSGNRTQSWNNRWLKPWERGVRMLVNSPETVVLPKGNWDGVAISNGKMFSKM